MSENKLLVAGGPEVAEYTLESALVVQTRVGSMTTKSGDGVTKIRPSPQHGVHERAEGALIRLSVHFGGREFDEMLIWQCWGGNRTGVRHSIVL